MVLSKRERYIGIACGTALGLLILNQLVLVPLEAQRGDLEQQIAKAQGDVEKQLLTIKKSRELSPRWSEMNRAGLLKSESAANSQIYNAVSNWARDAQLQPPPALKSDRTEKEKEFSKITIRGTGNGGMEQISKFLWHVQTANFPVRVTDLTLSSRREGTDDLSLQLGLATTYYDAEAAGAGRNNQREGRR